MPTKKLYRALAKMPIGYKLRIWLLRRCNYQIGEDVFIGEDLIVIDDLDDNEQLEQGKSRDSQTPDNRASTLPGPSPRYCNNRSYESQCALLSSVNAPGSTSHRHPCKKHDKRGSASLPRPM